MNRHEVIMTIKTVGEKFSRAMSALNGEEFAAGYRQAISDMIKVFGKVPLDPDFEAERKAMLAHIKALTDENELLKTECGKNHETIEELMKHVDIHEVLGIGKNRGQEEPKTTKRRVSFFTFE